jgi:ABC-type transport system substrate-binding protein
MVGPTYPGVGSFYDLGNLPPYQYNVTLANQILANANINPNNFPPLEFRVIAGCGICINSAQVVQNDLSAIGITVNVEVTAPSQYGPPYVGGGANFPTEVNQSQITAQISWFGVATFAPNEPTPADSWVTWVSNQTSSGNWAIYYNAIVQNCVNGFTNGATPAQLLTSCTAAQKQVYDDAPYVWLGSLKLWFGGGSIVYDKRVVKGFLGDPVFSGQSDTAIFNTVAFVNDQ